MNRRTTLAGRLGGLAARAGRRAGEDRRQGSRLGSQAAQEERAPVPTTLDGPPEEGVARAARELAEKEVEPLEAGEGTLREPMLEVSGAGLLHLNGTLLAHVGSFNGAPALQGRATLHYFDMEKVEPLAIRRAAFGESWAWVLAALPTEGGQERTARILYWNNATEMVPPRVGWVVAQEGKAPAPQLAIVKED